MTMPTLTLCRTCVTDDPSLRDHIQQAMAQAGLQAPLQQVDCMSGCTKPPTLAIRQTGKTAYLFGEITAGDMTDLVAFLRLYAASADGNFADARPLGRLRFKALARIPG